MACAPSPQHRATAILPLLRRQVWLLYCDRLLLLKEGRLVGELDMRRAKADEVKKKLSLIYGDIELLQSGDSFLMGKAL